MGRVVKCLFAISLSVALLFSALPQAQAAEAVPGRFIAIAYDDSGSMRYLDRKDVLKNYIYANYALQTVAAMLQEGDTAKVFRFSDRGQSPVALTKRKDLYGELKSLTAVKAGGTYADTINVAFKAGAAYLEANPQGQFLFVLITDGGMLFGSNNRVIGGPLKSLFHGYLKSTGLGALAGRCSALLVSAGPGSSQSSVSDMAAALGQSGIPAQTFLANVRDKTSAQGNIMKAAAGLAKAMAGMKTMEIVPGKPFTISDPLESLVVMEQFGQGGETLITGSAGSDGTVLKRSTLASARAIDGLSLACTFSDLAPSSGFVKPGQYTLQASGKVKLLAFLKVAPTADVSATTLPTATQQPSATTAPSATQQPAAEASLPSSQPEVTPSAVSQAFDPAGLDILSKNTFTVQYTSDAEFKKAAEFTMEGRTQGALSVNFDSTLPKGLQILFNGVVFDAGHPAGDVDIKASNTVGIWVNSEFDATGIQALKMNFADGEALQINVLPQPRQMKVELSTVSLDFGVLDGKTDTPASAFKVLILEDGAWAELQPAKSTINTIAPAGLGISLDSAAQKLSVYSGWPALITPTGRQTVTLRASTGKPGEQADGSISLLVRDDWRKWLILVELVVVALAALYAAMLASKKRLPLDLAVISSGNSDMAFAVKAELRRNLKRRKFWPFGQETCTCGLLEIHPHLKRRDLVILSGECAQYNLRIDGRLPQHHKACNEAGDYIISARNIIGIQGFGGYRYYRIIPSPSALVKK